MRLRTGGCGSGLAMKRHVSEGLGGGRDQRRRADPITSPLPKLPVALVSISHASPATEEWLKRLSDYETQNVGLLAQVLGLLAGSRAMSIPRLLCFFKQWDIAAGRRGLLRAAGGTTLFSLEGVGR